MTLQRAFRSLTRTMLVIPDVLALSYTAGDVVPGVVVKFTRPAVPQLPVEHEEEEMDAGEEGDEVEEEEYALLQTATPKAGRQHRSPRCHTAADTTLTLRRR